MKTYLEIKVPISYDAFWFSELRKALKDVPVHWQNDYAIMRSYLDNANAVSMTFNKLDVFTTNNGMKIVHLTTDSIPDNFQKLVNNIRNDISANTSTSILSDFRLHVTLGRIAEAEADVDDIGFLIDEIDFMPINLTLNEVEYRVFRGRSLYKATLN